MTNLMVWAVATIVIVTAAAGWYYKQQHDAEQRGAQLERDKIAAQANQNIAERRVRDAEFDRTDAMQLCKDAGLEWYADTGHSYCRVKPAQ